MVTKNEISTKLETSIISHLSNEEIEKMANLETIDEFIHEMKAEIVELKQQRTAFRKEFEQMQKI